jgi:WD40 repeat protein
LNNRLGNNVTKALELLDGCPANLRDWEWDYAWRRCHLDLRTFHERGLPSPGQSVNGVAFSPDGARLASVTGAFAFAFVQPGQTSDLIVRDLSSGEEVFSRRGVRGSFRSVAFSPDSRMIAAGNDSALVVWDLTTNSERFRVTDPDNFALRSLAYSPDGRRIIAGYSSVATTDSRGHARLFDASTGKELRDKIPGQTGPVRCVAFSPSGREIALAGTGLVEVQDLGGRKPILKLQGHDGAVNAVAFSPDGQYIASGGNDRTLRLWDPATGHQVRVFHGHEGFIRGLAFRPDSRWLLSASEDKSLRLWEVASGSQLAAYPGHQQFVICAAFSPDGQSFASGGFDLAVKIWSVTRRVPLTHTGHDGWVSGLAFSPDGRRIASGAGYYSTRSRLEVWDATTDEPRVAFTEESPPVHAITYRADGRHLATACADGTVRIWDVDTGRRVRTLPQQATEVRDVAYSPDGHLLASATAKSIGLIDREPGEVKLWDADTGREVRTLAGHTAGVHGVAYSPDGRWLASACGDGLVRVWDVTDPGRAVLTLRGHAGQVKRVVFLPDGRLASAGGIPLTTGEVKIWDLATGQVLDLHGHTDLVFGLDSSPDGQRLATGGWDRTVKLWDTSTGQEVFTLTGHTSGVIRVAYSPDGRRIASGSIDWTVKVWDTSPPEDDASLRRDDVSRSGLSELPADPFAR